QLDPARPRRRPVVGADGVLAARVGGGPAAGAVPPRTPALAAMPPAARRHALQQAALAELGLLALEGASFDALAAYAASAAADALGVPLAAVLARRGSALVLVAGAGWPDGGGGEPLLAL